jgi:hypothetical protein
MRRSPIDPIAELRAWAKSHAALQVGRGNADDVLAFADWLEAIDRIERARRSPWLLRGFTSRDARLGALARRTASTIHEKFVELRSQPPR